MAYTPRHGALICHLIFGFRFPLLWIFFQMNLTPFFLLWTGLVWIGDGIVNRLKRRIMYRRTPKPDSSSTFIMNLPRGRESVPGSVTLIAKDTGKSVQAVASGKDGHFTISEVTPQRYILKLEKEDSCPKLFRGRSLSRL
jgi:hypothetical protein